MRCVLSPDPSPLWKLTPSSLLGLCPRLDPSRPQDVAESIAAESLRRSRCCACQTKVWRISDMRVARPLHVRRAPQLCGGGGSQLRSGKGTHFRALLERFSEGEGSDDVPLAERASIGKSRAIARSENEDDDVGEGDQELQQQAGPCTDMQAQEPRCLAGYPTAQCPPHSYTSPDPIARALPFGVYAPGTTPDRDGQQGARSRVARGCGVRSWPVARAPGWKAGRHGRSFAESAETARRCGSESGNRRGWCARYTFTEAEEGPVGGRGYVPVPVGALEEPDDVKVKSAGMIKGLGLGILD
jgi:hypothetical protein